MLLYPAFGKKQSRACDNRRQILEMLQHRDRNDSIVSTALRNLIDLPIYLPEPFDIRTISVKRLEWLDHVVRRRRGLVGKMIQRARADLQQRTGSGPLCNNSMHPGFDT